MNQHAMLDLALRCMLRVLLLVNCAGCGWCHIAKLDLARLCTLRVLLLVSSAGSCMHSKLH